MTFDFQWADPLARDVQFGYLTRNAHAPKRNHPQVVLNGPGSSVLRALREELNYATAFTFSVAFITPRAIALLKQELVEFAGTGRIITSDYLSFNSPEAFAELLNLRRLGFDIRVHHAKAFHPKGYIFEHPDAVTALIGSANLTESALVTNHEWNLKVSAAWGSDLAKQFLTLIDDEVRNSQPLTSEWVSQYSETRLTAAARPTFPSPRVEITPAQAGASPSPDVEVQGVPMVVPRTEPPRDVPGRQGESSLEVPATPSSPLEHPQRLVTPNGMQREALRRLADCRRTGARRAIVISATGTGKTILSALDVRAFGPDRMLFVAHREQILDRTMSEYRDVLNEPPEAFGKLTGTAKQPDRKYVFSTIQTLAQPDVLADYPTDAFDYIIIDEAHRAGAESYRRVIDHFTPKFLLGMTATPERTDGFNVFELFDYNVPYEIRLNHALAEDMLCPFHYYGIADVTFEDGSTVTDTTGLPKLVSAERVDYLVNALETYGQAGIQPRGLIFCSRNDEAARLSEALNQKTLHGRLLRTLALSGNDSVAARESAVERLERGDLDYILTVDIFNEGVDIPSVNQVVMLRQTQSAIVFVQQLGRGLRKAPSKEYVVVLDFIGNYTSNFLIPIALFGEDSLNKESIRKELIAAEEAGVLPGLSSVRFDRISQERVLRSISTTTLDTLQRLKNAIVTMRNRVGRLPKLWDFYRFESVDPVLLATKKDHYLDLLKATVKEDVQLSRAAHAALTHFSHEVLPAKRLHEFVILQALLDNESVGEEDVRKLLEGAGLTTEHRLLASAIATFTLDWHADGDRRKYSPRTVVRTEAGALALAPDVRLALRSSEAFREAVEDLLRTGEAITRERYADGDPFRVGMQYSRKDVARLLGWPPKWSSTIYGYKADAPSGECPIFVTLHKSSEISKSTAYEDQLLDRSTLLWYTRSRRTLDSDEVRLIVERQVRVRVFVKKDDAEGTDFYYLGQAIPEGATETTMPDDHGAQLSVVRMNLHFAEPVDSALYDYFHPTVTLSDEG